MELCVLFRIEFVVEKGHVPLEELHAYQRYRRVGTPYTHVIVHEITRALASSSRPDVDVLF